MFKFSDGIFELFKIKSKLSKKDLSSEGSTPVYSSESSNNGIIGYTKQAPQFTISKETPYFVVFGDHTRCFNIATEDFCVADNVKVLGVNKHHSIRLLLFITSSWSKNIPNKGYARHWTIAKDVYFDLPVRHGKLDVAFMERFIAELEAERIAELEAERIAEIEAYLKTTGLKNYQLTPDEKQALQDFEDGKFIWKELNLESLYGKSTRGRRLKSLDRISGDLPFVTAGEKDCGISAFIGNDITVFPENTVTIDMFGSAKYRNYKYGGDDHIAVVHTHLLPKLASVFVATSTHKSSHTDKFSYSRNFYAKDADELQISLPVKGQEPDYALMETFISAIQKLVIKDVVLYADQKIAATNHVING